MCHLHNNYGYSNLWTFLSLVRYPIRVSSPIACAVCICLSATVKIKKENTAMISR